MEGLSQSLGLGQIAQTTYDCGSRTKQTAHNETSDVNFGGARKNVASKIFETCNSVFTNVEFSTIIIIMRNMGNFSTKGKSSAY